MALRLLFYALPLVILEFFMQKKGDLLAWQNGNLVIRVGFVTGLLLLLLLFGNRTSNEFIYFQF
jgi:hypothetical protein